MTKARKWVLGSQAFTLKIQPSLLDKPDDIHGVRPKTVRGIAFSLAWE